jgi:hypothetical protein
MAALFVVLVPAAADELRLGTAAVKITPPLGTPMAGYYGARGSQGVLDDLYAKAAVLSDGRTKVALVACDLIGLPREVVVEARRLIAEKTGIAADSAMISATHTHTGPAVVGDSLLDELVTGGSKLSQDYTRQLPSRIAEAVAQANDRLAAARISYGSKDEPEMSFIRRFWMKDGTVGWNPGKLNANVIRPIGTIDPQVNVVYAETSGKPVGAPDRITADGSHHVEASGSKPLLTYVNFANHLDTTGGRLISADFPATLARRLADYKGPEMLTMFANGTCGNINHLDVGSAVGQTGPEEARRLGTILAATVLKSYMRLKDVEDTTLRVRRDVLQLPLAGFTEEDLRAARQIASRNGKGAAFLEQVKAYRVLDVAARNGKPYEVDVQVFALGREIAWVALPGEVFVELGRSVKTASPFRQTNVVELSNGVSYYVPNRSAYAEGQYEVVSTRFAEGAGEMLVTSAIRLLAELHRDAGGAGVAKQTAGN